MASKPGFLETDLDQCSFVEDDFRIAVEHSQMATGEDLETAIAQTASSFATIKESLHNLLEKMRLNRMETPRKCPARTDVHHDGVGFGSSNEPDLSLVSAVEDDRRSAMPWWSSESSCDFDSDDSGFQFDSKNRKFVMDHSGSSEMDLSDEGSFWEGRSVADGFGSIGCELTTTVRCAVDKCCSSGGSGGHSMTSGQLGGSNTRSKYRAREVLAGKGQLKVALYINSGLLTIHVEKAKKLESKKSKLCNSYVKIEVIPKPSKRPNCRTLLVKNDNCPLFDQKFSFELTSGNENKRVFISVWHRDLYRRNSEFLGCMSFGIAHVTKHPAHGWYRLMTDKLGKNKHFEVKSGGRISSILQKVGIYSSSSKLSRPQSKENLIPAATKYLSAQKGMEQGIQPSNVSLVSSHQNHHHSYHQHHQQRLHDRPTANSTQENGLKIRVRAQIECWRKCDENKRVQKRRSIVLKSSENTEGMPNNSNEVKVRLDHTTTLGSYELFMDASLEEDDKVKTTHLSAEKKYPNTDRIWFIDEVSGNHLADL